MFRMSLLGSLRLSHADFEIVCGHVGHVWVLVSMLIGIAHVADVDLSVHVVLGSMHWLSIMVGSIVHGAVVNGAIMD